MSQSRRNAKLVYVKGDTMIQVQIQGAQGCAHFAEILLSARYCGVCAR